MLRLDCNRQVTHGLFSTSGTFTKCSVFRRNSPVTRVRERGQGWRTLAVVRKSLFMGGLMGELVGHFTLGQRTEQEGTSATSENYTVASKLLKAAEVRYPE